MASPEPPRDDIFHPGGQLVPECLNEAAANALREACRLARDTHWDTIRSPHIFMGLLSAPDKGMRAWGQRLDADLTKLLGQFQELFHQEHGDSDALLILNREFMSDNVIRLLRDSHARAARHGRACVTPMDMLISLLTTSDSIVAECFERVGVTAAKLTEFAVLAEQQSGSE
ncbi:MAG: hypothetical protein L0215_17860 [Gemmataceae bacterium]|nr:hypothetical protein [Gemmataceae bacterium]